MNDFLHQFLSNIKRLPIEVLITNMFSGIYDERWISEVIYYIVKTGYRFTTRDELVKLKKIVPYADMCGLGFNWPLANGFAKAGYDFDLSELITLENPSNIYGRTVAHEMAMQGHQFCLSDLKALGNPPDGSGITIAHLMANNGFKFTVDELLALGDSPDFEKITISHCMVRGGHQFTFDEIIRLNNPAELFGVTLSHWMARWGHRFTIDELIKIGNPVITYPEGNLYFNDGIYYKLINDDVEYESKRDLMHNGATVAHIMAREGHQFSFDEIKALGNPKDAAGRTLADWMASKGNPLTDGGAH
jgi:hypothetical protein